MRVKLNEEIKEYCRLLNLKGFRSHFEDVMAEANDYE